SCLAAIAEAVRARVNPGPADISAVMSEINQLLDASIEGVAMSTRSVRTLDLSKIDFESLAKRFLERKPKRVEVERLKAAVRVMLERLIRLNRTRLNFQEQFEQLIESYNNGSRNIEEMLEQLLAFTCLLNEEA